MMVGKVHTQGRGRVQSRAPEKNEVEQNYSYRAVGQLGLISISIIIIIVIISIICITFSTIFLNLIGSQQPLCIA